MKYNHAVKFKGEFYPTGADVPVEDEAKEAEIKTECEENADDKAGEVGEVTTEPNAEATKEAKADEKPAKNK